MIEFDDIKAYNWHDCPLYSIRFDDNFEMDIDYILKWERLSNLSFRFLLAPAKLVFYEVTNLHINVNTSFLNGFEINRITKNDSKWIIELQEGIISLESKGFKQELLKDPIWKDDQYLSEEERKGRIR